MQYSIVNKSNIDTGLYRLDSEYYVGISKIKVTASTSDNLFALCDKIVQGPNPSFVEKGIPCFNGKNIYFGTANADEPNYISGAEYSRLKDFHLKANDILITLKHATRVGRLWIYKGNEKAVFTRNLGLIRLSKNSRINAPTLLFYLWGTIPQALLNLIATGGTNGQITLGTTELKKFPIPTFGKTIQDLIEQIFLRSEDLLDKANYSYRQAERILLSELGLLNWKPEHRLAFVKNFSDIQTAERIDAEYFQPTYTEAEQHLKRFYNAEPLAQYDFLDITTGQYVDTYVDKSDGVPYIRGTDLTSGTVNMEDLVYIAPFNQIKSKKAKEGDVVVTRVGTIGLSARIPKGCEEGTISDNLIRIRIKSDKLNSYFLTLFLNTLLGKSLMIRHSRGSVQQRLNQETLKEIIVPILPKDTQARIAEAVVKSYQAKDLSRRLLEVAKTGVEIAIEKDETSAINWIKQEIFEHKVVL